jgi:hypothetical protein
MSFEFLDSEKIHLEQSCERLSIVPTRQFLIISISKQSLFLFSDNEIIQSYTISTSKNPPSCLNNSYGTPIGLHAVSDKIGDGEFKGTVFKGRVSQGYSYHDAPLVERSKNLITSRIIRIRGLDPSLNAGGNHDSYSRYIYIHGTNHEQRLGEAFSLGCIEMSNDDCIDLFDRISINSLIWIA